MRHSALIFAAFLAACSEVPPPSPGPPGLAAAPRTAPDVTAWPADLTVSLTLTREYGLSIFSCCRLEVLVFDDRGTAVRKCQRTDGSAIRASADLSGADAVRLRELVRASDLYAGGHVGEDWTPGDGTVESLRIRPGAGGPAVVLVVSGNKTFEAEGPRSCSSSDSQGYRIEGVEGAWLTRRCSRRAARTKGADSKQLVGAARG
jgi:hypothetical protein